MKRQTQTEIQRINGYLKEVVTLFDSSGKPISSVINPLMVELAPRDVLQIFVGALLFATPLSFTEEVWTISLELPSFKVYLLSVFSLVTVTLFIYFNFYRHRLKGHLIEFVKRVFATYLISISSVALMLYLIDKLPFEESPEVAIRRLVIIGFPSVFGATLSDYIK